MPRPVTRPPERTDAAAAAAAAPADVVDDGAAKARAAGADRWLGVDDDSRLGEPVQEPTLKALDAAGAARSALLVEELSLADLAELLRHAQLRHEAEVAGLRAKLARFETSLEKRADEAAHVGAGSAPLLLVQAAAATPPPGLGAGGAGPPPPPEHEEDAAEPEPTPDARGPSDYMAPGPTEEASLEHAEPSHSTEFKASKRSMTLRNFAQETGPEHILVKATRWAETGVGFLIFLNVVFIYLELEHDGDKASVHIGKGSNGWELPSEEAFRAVSTFTTVVFFVELVLKLAFLRKRFFYENGLLQKFNVFDLVIVSTGCLEQWVLTPALQGDDSNGGRNIAMARLVRIFRLIRTVRIFRTLEMFAKLRVLVATTLASFGALFWSMVLLTVVMVIAAFMLCQSLNLVFFDDTIDESTKEWVYRFYGSPSKSMWTIFEVTYSGGWPNYARPLVENVSAGYAFFFILYISCVTFALFRIITALFLRDTLCVATADTEMMIQEKMKEKSAYKQKLYDFFVAADESGDGMLTEQEFVHLASDERVRSYLATLEIDVRESAQLFTLLDDGDGRVPIDEFVSGAMRLRGQARSQDVVSIMHDCTKLMRKMEKIEALVEALKPAA